MTTFTIAPRYADRKGTVPIPTWRNVHDSDGDYIGAIYVHDGRWTPLYASDDFRRSNKVDALQAAAEKMNSEDGR